MTVEKESETLQIIEEDVERDKIIKSLAKNNEICFKSQQKWEKDLTLEEKFEIGLKLYNENRLQFLIKFGKYLKHPELHSFKELLKEESNNEEINILVNDLMKSSQGHTQNVVVKNRRYQAMMQMIQDSSYFSELEMMKRNPLLYNQLIGQYLSAAEKKERDKYEMNSETSFVKILMEGIDRDNAEAVRQHEEEIENNQMEEEDDSDEEESDISASRPSTSHWGEFEGSKNTFKTPNITQKSTFITLEERKLLKDEFVTTMYESFLDGKDEDFNYDKVDNDTSYDDMHEIDNDEEEKYFDSEEVGDDGTDENLVIESGCFMNSCNQDY
ncbi:coiled-coil domain-containing protein 97 [Diabrotica virgifera virgifera]|uniref:Coiled-coil domain-containing protein 97 n=1 Tax=Diabrotica virgifera virgifera TaxID=50390 RepID=A0A6P7GAY8_DIAVI|nr:coiled-coil domain-containing protein 97 [Diabrotica virgifera virgifera]